MAAKCLEKKSIVVIGGTTGLGLSAALAFIERGARVVVVGRKLESVEAAQRSLGKRGAALSGDAAHSDTAVKAISEARKRFGGFDGLYHVAGGSGRRMGDGPVHELTDEGWRGTLELNLTSLIYSNRAATRQFLAQKTGGSILNMSSVLGWSPSVEYFATHAYAATKSAVLGFSKAVAAYYARYNIRCNVIAPAVVETPMAQRAMGDEEIMNFLKTKQPLDGGRVGVPQDLDAAAVYFMSDESKFTTGQLLAVDGGWSLSEGQVERAAAPKRRAQR